MLVSNERGYLRVDVAHPCRRRRRRRQAEAEGTRTGSLYLSAIASDFSAVNLLSSCLQMITASSHAPSLIKPRSFLTLA